MGAAPAWLTARPIAHRGLHDAAAGVIENTASAFEAAIAGHYAIECDLQRSADGEAMVFHDDTLERLTTASGRLDAQPGSALQAAAFRQSADRMQTLRELCRQVAGRTPLIIELKSHFDGDHRLAARVAEVLADYAGPAAVMSFDPGPIAALRDLAPALPRGLTAQARRSARADGEPRTSAARFVMQALAARLDFLAWRVQDLPGAVPATARSILGLPVLTWTVRTAEDRARAARHADQMIFEGFQP